MVLRCLLRCLIRVMFKLIDFMYVFLPCANEVWGKVIFSVACVKNSVHRGGTSSSTPPPRAGTPNPPGQVPPGRYPLGRYPPGLIPPGHLPPGHRYTPGQVHPWAGTPPGPVHAGRYGQQAGGTHPTGMHSCYTCVSFCSHGGLASQHALGRGG